MASQIPIMFSKFNVTPAVFHLTPLSFAIVNLKPLLPGHVLVCPRRVTGRLKDLSSAELGDLFSTVQRVSRMLERVYGAGALNVAMQDGRAAGQSVPHVHAHLIPRRAGDLPDDAIYPMLEGRDGDVGRQWAERLWDQFRDRDYPRFDKIDEDARRPRTDDEMSEEAAVLRKEMEKELDLEGSGGGFDAAGPKAEGDGQKL